MVANSYVFVISVMEPHSLLLNKVLDKHVAISSLYHEDGVSMFLRNIRNKVPNFKVPNFKQSA
jgi:hypothetical protein